MGTKIQVDADADLSSVKEELECQLLQELDPYKFMGPLAIHSRLLREMAYAVGKLLSMICEKSGKSGDISEDWRKANAGPTNNKDSKENPGDYRCINLTAIPGKVVEQSS